MFDRSTMRKPAFIEEELERRASSNRFRALRPLAPVSETEVRIDGRTVLNFSSNDYLGLSKHPALRQRADEFMCRYGVGATASRLICGTFDCCSRVEEKIAALKGTQAALILNSGYQANVSLLPALLDRNSLILSDRLNHRSLVDGALLSRCRVVRYRHNDLEHLRELLRFHRDRGHSRTLITTESVFSVDGDRSNIDALIELKQEFDALLMIDEAHATGVLGPRGMGLACGKPVDIVMGTFGKACGSFGSYVACSEKMRDYIVNCCAGFIYTTALPPAVIGSIDAALDLVPSMDRQRTDLHHKADLLRAVLRSIGFDTGRSDTQIVPAIVGNDRDALALSAWLESRGILAPAIRPPTVENGKSRIRLAVSAAHTEEHLARLDEALGDWSRGGA